MMNTEAAYKYLKDYKTLPYIVENVLLDVSIAPSGTSVRSEILLSPSSQKEIKEKICLYGDGQRIFGVFYDGRKLAETEYELIDKDLFLPAISKKTQISIEVEIHPETNTSLEGFYQSNANFYSQCEPEGFRKITYFFDRPDVMTVYTVRIEADKKKYPVLLSNGNLKKSGDLPGGKHFVVWEDPFKKPCYLFALVAGDLASIHDTYITKTNKKVSLAIYSEKINIDKCSFAMESLKKSMRWDEDTYGLECDLSDYKIVTVSDFNFGAMENKGLNIFNNSLVLADPKTTTDISYENIEGVIGHEYFHNWSGNRVTCRDWFQLCLKEGLTVYRDQEFSSDMSVRSVCRVRDVLSLKTRQYPEDSGAMVHPPRPDRFIEINNFYTATVYEKGAECVRMIETIIGLENFKKGMQLYFSRHDGQAVTQEDFIQAMVDASGVDLSQFSLWYTQAGRPIVSVVSEYFENDKTYTLTLEQETKETPFEKEKKPLHIPVRLALFAANGKKLLDEVTLHFKEQKQKFTFKNITEKPVPSLFRNLSAPVEVNSFLSEEELQVLAQHDDDPVNFWESCQNIYYQEINRIYKDGAQTGLSQKAASYLKVILKDEKRDSALRALALRPPLVSNFMASLKKWDVQVLFATFERLEKDLSLMLWDDFLESFTRLKDFGPYEFTPQAVAKRSLKNLCLYFLHKSGKSVAKELVFEQYEKATNMTDQKTALALISDSDFSERESLLAQFQTTWQHDPLVIDQWFQVQTTCFTHHKLEKIKSLFAHKDFHLKNPNRVRSSVISYCRANSLHFHLDYEESYPLCVDYTLKLNRINPQIAALLVRSFDQWQKLDEVRRKQAESSLKQIKNTHDLAADLKELAERLLKQGQ